MEDPVVRFLVEFVSRLDFDFQPCDILIAVLVEHPYLIPPLLLFIYLCYRGLKCFLKHRRPKHA